jgi:hypothetical protein
MKSGWRCASRLVANALAGEQEAADEGDLHARRERWTMARLAERPEWCRAGERAGGARVLVYGALEVTTSYREECDVAARVKGEVTEPARGVPFL